MKRQLWGVIILAIGILVLLQVTGVFELGLSFWPLVLLLLGIAIVWESMSHGFRSWFLLGLGLWVGGIGLFNILSAAGFSVLSGGDIARYGWPLMLVAIGLSILIGDRGWFGEGGCWSGKLSEDGSGKSCSRMRHIGDLYHGRAPWILDENLDFFHGIGDVVIDLTTAEIKPGSHRIFVKVGAGEVNVRLPGGVNLEVDASVGLGELELFGEQRSGIGGLSLRRVVQVEGAVATVQVEIKLGLGDLNVSYLPAVPGLSR